MTQWSKGKMILLSLALVGVMWLGAAAPARAITDTFELKATFKERCKENPRFVDPFTVKVSDGFTITFTRDDSNPTHLQATINTDGVSPDIDAIPLAGRAHFSNKTLSKVEFVVSGVNPGNPNHFLTLRGQGTVDRYGHLTKVAGTVFWQETTTYTIDKSTGAQSDPVECFSSGTFGAGKNLTWVPPPPPGTLRVTGAPSDVGGRFVTDKRLFNQQVHVVGAVIIWGEFHTGFPAHTETLLISILTDGTLGMLFTDTTVSISSSAVREWNFSCDNLPGCTGVTIDRLTGTLTFQNVVLVNSFNSTSTSTLAPITLNGILRFTPF